MTPEEKAAFDAKQLADAEAAKLTSDEKAKEQDFLDPIAEKDAEIARLMEERDNWKELGLKRKGKLADDDDFFERSGIDEFIKDKVREALADKEIAMAQAAKDAEIKRLVRENNELRLASKNRPGFSVGGGDGSGPEVKDNVFSNDQLKDLELRAKKLGADPQKFIENAKKNFLARR